MRSLLAQTVEDWELVVVDDGSPEDTAAALAPFASDGRITLERLPENGGLGAACNRALDRAAAPVVAYLPADDIWYADHLTTLLAALAGGAVLAHSDLGPAAGPDPGAAAGPDPGAVVGPDPGAAVGPDPGAAAGPDPGTAAGLQLVQVAHRRTADRWTERGELESDDLERLFWCRLRARGKVAATGRVTCAWTQHPGQRHRTFRAAYDGGLNVFRSRYRPRGPLRFAPSDGPAVDEAARYARFADRPPPPADGLRVLLVGELAYNPERILALEERGCRLFGLWTPAPLGFMTVGPLPFGHVEDVPPAGWRDTVRRIAPDVVYALLNWRAVPLAHEVLHAATGIPFVWHFKEAPQRCLARGEWALLAGLYSGADQVVLSSVEERDWLAAALGEREAHVLDGDLPSRAWLAGERSPRLSEADGAVHTVLLGRPYGFGPELVEGLARRDIRLHVHGSNGAAPVEPADWVRVLSRYDAGWLHPVGSQNGGDVRRATWDDLNVPARLPTLLAAGLPLLQPAAPGAVLATQALARRHGVGVLYEDLDDLAATLRDRRRMEHLRAGAWAVRERFTFDHHADRLVALLRATAGG